MVLTSTNAKFKQGVGGHKSVVKLSPIMHGGFLPPVSHVAALIEEQGEVRLHERVPLHAKYVLSILCCLLPGISSSHKEVALVVTPYSYVPGMFFFLTQKLFAIV